METKEVIEKHFWETISKKGQLEIAIESIERWLEDPDGTICPFSEEWQGGCSLCITFMQIIKGCPCPTHGVAYTQRKAKEVLQMLKSLPKGGRDDGEIHK